jgi:hypothetical protein
MTDFQKPLQSDGQLDAQSMERLISQIWEDMYVLISKNLKDSPEYNELRAKFIKSSNILRDTFGEQVLSNLLTRIHNRFINAEGIFGEI